METSSHPPVALRPRDHYGAIAVMDRGEWQCLRGSYLELLGMPAADAASVASAEHDTANLGDPVLDPDLVRRNYAALEKAESPYV